MTMNILIVEDSDAKFTAVSNLVVAECPTCSIVRAATVVEAEAEISTKDWSLVVLDISMDIAPSRMGHRSRGQANIGGLGIAQKMFLTSREFPTVVVTAFDAFKTSGSGQSNSEIVGYEEIQRRADQYLGNFLKACLQYNSPNWKADFRDAIKKAIKQ